MSSSPCKHSVEQYLQGTLSYAEGSAFEEHLEYCQECRERISNCAAEDRSWAEARKFLGSEVTLLDKAHHAKLSDSNIGGVDRELAANQILSLLAPTDDPNMLGRIGAYEISGVIGNGGMGVVLKGLDRALNRIVAIKLMSPHLATSGVARVRFLREAQAAAGIVHPNVVDIYGVAEFQGFPYLVMPYIRGCSLHRRVMERGPLPIEDVLRIGHQVAAGLSAAHSQGIVHRDIKPANILVGDGTDRVFITDFGLARTIDDASLTRSGTIAGTPQYMSPEQARGDQVDQRSDLFSLGSVLYFLCTGHPPFRAETMYGTLQRIATGQVREIREVNPSVPAWLCQLVSKCHALNLEERFQSAEQLSQLLEKCLAHVQQPLLNDLPQVLASQSIMERDGDHSIARQLLKRHVLIPSIVSLVLMSSIACYFSYSSILAWGTSAKPETKQERPSEIELDRTASSVPQLTSFHYKFDVGQTIGYLITVSSSQEAMQRVQIDGIILVKPKELSNQEWQLELNYILRTSIKDAKQQVAGLESGDASGSWWENSTRDSRENRSSLISIDNQGKSSHQGDLNLPFELGSVRQLVLPDLTQHSSSRVRGSESIQEFSNIQGGQVLFDAKSGVVDSVQAALSMQFPDSVSTGIPVHLEVTRLNPDELKTWLAIDGSNAETKANEESKLKPEDKAECIADLHNDHRVIYWLHRLQGIPEADYSDDLIDALILLGDHANPTVRTLAARLVAKLPVHRLNPFRPVE